MLSIRPAKPDDAFAIWRVHIASIQKLCNSHYDDAVIEAWVASPIMDGYRRAMGSPEKRTIVAENEDGVVGFGTVDIALGFVDLLYVAPSHIRSGVGSGLLAELEKIAARHCVETLRLSSSLNAISFYEWAGYSQIGPSEHTLPGGVKVACVTMKKRLKG